MVKKQIQEWLNVVGKQKNQEWLIVYVNKQEAKRGMSLLGALTNIYEKIRSDFNVGKRER
jgi:uncharacterized protein YlbG (UPF0298 family)